MAWLTGALFKEPEQVKEKERQQAQFAWVSLPASRRGKAGSAVTPWVPAGACLHGDSGDGFTALSWAWLWKPLVPLKAVLLKRRAKPQKDEQRGGLRV